MNLANLDLSMGEVAPMEIRSPALYMYQFLQSCSQLVASGVTQGCNSLNTSLGYKLPMGGLTILPLAMFLWLPFISESPTWCVFRGKTESAAKSLRKIHRTEAGYYPSADIAFLE